MYDPSIPPDIFRFQDPNQQRELLSLQLNFHTENVEVKRDGNLVTEQTEARDRYIFFSYFNIYITNI